MNFKKFFHSIFPLLFSLSFLCTCDLEKPHNEIIIYFQNTHFDDGPVYWPEFHNYEELDAVRFLDDIYLPTTDFKKLEKKLHLISDRVDSAGTENSIYSYDENIYIITNQMDSIYFTKNNMFFDKNDLFICKDKDLAEFIRSTIKYRIHFSEEKEVIPIYSKIKIRSMK